MFTGIIQAVGKVREPEKLGDGVRLTIVAPKEFHLDEVKVGDSIACNGACMTVTGINGDEFNVDVSAESLSKTVGLNTFGYINLEKAMRLGDRVAVSDESGRIYHGRASDSVRYSSHCVTVVEVVEVSVPASQGSAEGGTAHKGSHS